MKNALQDTASLIKMYSKVVFWWIGPQFEALTLCIYLFMAIARLAAWIRGVLWIDRSHFHPPKIFPDLQTMDHLDKHVELHMDWIHFHSKTWAQNILQITCWSFICWLVGYIPVFRTSPPCFIHKYMSFFLSFIQGFKDVYHGNIMEHTLW